MTLYPLEFIPFAKEKIWGGTKLFDMLNKPFASNCVGESWEIAAVDNFVSRVANGALAGESLEHLIQKYQHKLLGNSVYERFGDQFPLLIKFIDAKENLSIQLHPNDALARARHNSFGKTEMWYVMQADPNASLIVGFESPTTKAAYLQLLQEDKIESLMRSEQVQAGDAYFIPVGTIHAIGKGTLIAEIQQTSDITYRIYDWNRKDNQGNSRELHTDLALDALDFTANLTYKCAYQNHRNHPNKITSCPYFTTNKISVSEKFTRTLSHLDSFVIYICVSGSGTIQTNPGTTHQIPIQKGKTVLIPAIFEQIIFRALDLEVLEVYIPK